MTIKYDTNGLVPAIIQDAATKNVLMLGYMNEEAYQKTLETKKITFFSDTRTMSDLELIVAVISSILKYDDSEFPSKKPCGWNMLIPSLTTALILSP